MTLQVGDLYIISYFEWETGKSCFKTKANLWPSAEGIRARSAFVAGNAGITRTIMGYCLH